MTRILAFLRRLLHRHQEEPYLDDVQPVDLRLAGEYGRLLAERDRLIADGADPGDLLVPERPL